VHRERSGQTVFIILVSEHQVDHGAIVGGVLSCCIDRIFKVAMGGVHVEQTELFQSDVISFLRAVSDQARQFSLQVDELFSIVKLSLACWWVSISSQIGGRFPIQFPIDCLQSRVQAINCSEPIGFNHQ
jgi:hypothetical protein